MGGGISDGIRILTGTGSLHDICLDARNNDSFKIGSGAGDELQLRQSNTGVVFADRRPYRKRNERQQCRGLP